MTTADRLLARLRKLPELPTIPEGAECRRLYPGKAARSIGAWSWGIYAPELPVDIGSQWPMSVLIRGDIVATWSHYTGDWSIDPK